jgi:hypothetical protein
MGRVPEGAIAEGGYKSPKITYLWPHHRRMARLAASGLTPGEIKTVTGFSEGQISRILGTPMFQAVLHSLEKRADEQAVDLREDIKRLAEIAVENLSEDLSMEIADRGDRKIRQEASKDILDRAGYRKSDRPIHGDLHLHKHDHVHEMSDEELRDDVLDLVKTEDTKD